MKIENLYYYPIKSCSGIETQTLELGPFGVPYDRKFMLIDENGVFITQRKFSKLALVSLVDAQDRFRLSYPDMEDINLGKDCSDVNTVREAKIFGNAVKSFEADSTVSEWFSNILSKNVSLVHTGPETTRIRTKDYHPEPIHLNFADSMPLLLINRASHRRLLELSTERFSIDRFRSNVIIDSGDPFNEHEWNGIRLGGIEVPSLVNCDRCVITSIDQKSGKKTKDALHVLNVHRRINGKAVFGLRLAYLGVGLINVGDSVTPSIT